MRQSSASLLVAYGSATATATSKLDLFGGMEQFNDDIYVVDSGSAGTKRSVSNFIPLNLGSSRIDTSCSCDP